ncbi:hypothetical protein DL98DRAFT_627577 [Cadophora sp. DSE1049]|nr:hypothetical protein DL98DRAFT_627577 [Cadophora sp. DSE1049]
MGLTRVELRWEEDGQGGSADFPVNQESRGRHIGVSDSDVIVVVSGTPSTPSPLQSLTSRRCCYSNDTRLPSWTTRCPCLILKIDSHRTLSSLLVLPVQLETLRMLSGPRLQSRHQLQVLQPPKDGGSTSVNLTRPPQLLHPANVEDNHYHTLSVSISSTLELHPLPTRHHRRPKPQLHQDDAADTRDRQIYQPVLFEYGMPWPLDTGDTFVWKSVTALLTKNLDPTSIKAP